MREAAATVSSEPTAGSATAAEADPDTALLSFQGFSAAQVLARGTLLLSSGGKVRLRRARVSTFLHHL